MNTHFTTTLGALLRTVDSVIFDGVSCCAYGDCGEDGRVSGWRRLSFGRFITCEPDYEFIADPAQQVEVLDGCLTIKAIDDSGAVDLETSALIDVDLVVGMVRPPTMDDVDAVRNT